jgi:hypothetical protein
VLGLIVIVVFIFYGRDFISRSGRNSTVLLYTNLLSHVPDFSYRITVAAARRASSA